MEKIILICATGRSGSTTLQRIVNTIKNSDITGEKGVCIEFALKSYLELKHCKHIQNFKEPYTEKTNKKKPCWYNTFDIEEVKENYRKLIISLISGQKDKRVIGFKEIRWFENCKDDSLIETFVELFPETKIICHIDDNLKRQSQSSWFKKDPNSLEDLKTFNEKIIKYSKKEYCYLSYMKDLFCISKQRQMFEFLGEKLNEKTYKYIIENKYE